MIIFRYLAREVLTTMAAVSLILLAIIMSGRFVGYLAEAASGKLDAAVLLTLMGYRLPSFLELILPLGLFIGILLAYGRLHVESEMTVLAACGMSERRLLAYTLAAATAVAVVVGAFSLYLSPLGVRASELLLAEQRSRTEFETLKPGRFHKLSDGAGVSYVEELDENSRELARVFLAGTGATGDTYSVITASRGSTLPPDADGRRYLQLSDGQQYTSAPGSLEMEAVAFDTYRQLVPVADVLPQKATDSASTLALLDDPSNAGRAALVWRLSLPLLVLIVALLAVPLSRTRPRSGRYAKLIPAILLYLVYLVSSNAARGMLEEGTAPFAGILWAVHGGFLLLGLTLFAAPSVLRTWRQRNL